MTWEARKDGRYYYCFVSGGHVVLGSRLDSAILVDESKTASVEDFLKPTSTFPDYVKEVLYPPQTSPASAKSNRPLADNGSINGPYSENGREGGRRGAGQGGGLHEEEEPEDVLATERLEAV